VLTAIHAKRFAFPVQDLLGKLKLVQLLHDSTLGHQTHTNRLRLISSGMSARVLSAVKL